MQKLKEFIQSEDLWEPETVRSMYKNVTEEQFNFLMAAVAVGRSERPWFDYHIFDSTVKALNFKIPDFNSINGCTVEELWNAIDIMKQLRPNWNFSWEVGKYIQRISNDQGFYIYHPSLDMDEDDEVTELVNDRLKSGPWPLGDDFVSRQAAQALAVEMYVKEFEKSHDFSWV